MKKIFNSLGSNYNPAFAIKALGLVGLFSDNSKLVALLNTKYGGETKLVYKGREAIKLALDIVGLPKGSKVGINGFTCYVVYKAVIDVGHTPVMLDVSGRDINFSPGKLKEKGRGLKAVIVQNTFGVPCDIVNIKNYCDMNGVILIEDLAHSAGSYYDDGREAGTVGDFTALSFSQDKMIDSVSGGALVVRNDKYRKTKISGFQKLSPNLVLSDRFYPSLTLLIRYFYPIGVGRLLHFISKKLKILSRPISGNTNIVTHSLPGWYSHLALRRFTELGELIKHRRKIAQIYANRINKNLLSMSYLANIKHSSNIRFPIFTKERVGLVEFLKREGVYISDTWYDAPIAPKKYLKYTNYKTGMCPVSEKISHEIVNLPTHINVSATDAFRISDCINKWQNTK